MTHKQRRDFSRINRAFHAMCRRMDFCTSMPVAWSKGAQYEISGCRQLRDGRVVSLKWIVRGITPTGAPDAR